MSQRNPRNATQLAYKAIRIEGGLIPADELARLTALQSPEQTEQTDAAYGIPKGLKLRDEIGRAFKIAQNLWADFQLGRARTDVDPARITRDEFLEPLLRQVLGYADLAGGVNLRLKDHDYPVGHTARGGSLPVVLAGHDALLDTPADRWGETNPETQRVRRRSPFGLAQEALNASDDSLWAVVSNGLSLRILRDNPSLTRPAYVEVDLEAIFTEELYADFTAFWLLAHVSRFGVAGAEPADCPWERWRATGQEAGVRARDRLRDGVADALRALGTGFLRHPANGALRAALQGAGGAAPTLGAQGFFEELLALVYRFIFLATVEDRVDAQTAIPLVFAPATPEAVRQRYLAGYSLTWLRERAARRSQHDAHSDLWQALSITFEGLATGQPALGLPALGGLFDHEQCPHLAGAQIENRWLLGAIFQLGWFRDAGGLTRVNYRDMGPEELGSVYESLLELVPELQSLAQPHAARLAFVGDTAGAEASSKGNARKLTGSYYTPDSLVQELIKSALEPVIAQTLGAHRESPVEALLSLTVCDPACGSGHFLLAAARRIADELARLRAPGGAPTQDDYRHALRDVVSRCIYGVDRNPMAVALAKTALWLEAYTPDKPLSFLDHHIRCGDALLGVLDPSVLDHGIPEVAYKDLSGDDKTSAAALRKQNRAELKSWKAASAANLFNAEASAARAAELEQWADDSLAAVAAKRAAWAQAAVASAGSRLARAADVFVAAFLAPKTAADLAGVPLSGHLWALLNDGAAHPAIESAAQALCRRHQVFHWWLAFPQVAAQGGFAVMLGNPPWERIKLQEEEFFAARSPLVAGARNKAERGSRIELLRQGLLLHTLYPDVEAAEGLSPPNHAEMRLYADFLAARRGAEAVSLYAHDSGRFPLTGVGDVNTYALFAETFLQLLSASGRAGFIVPTGIATDDSTKAYFSSLIRQQSLVSLFSFYEIRRWFPATDDRKAFCLLTLGNSTAADFAYDIRDWSGFLRLEKRYRLTSQEFRALNPNTLTLPVFRSQRDAELTKKLYRAAPVLIRELPDGAEENPWGIRFATMFHMSNDSGLFLDGPAPEGAPQRLPLYEAKMIHQFDHRWATFVDSPAKGGLDTADVDATQKTDPAYTVRPRYWVEESEVLARIARVPRGVANAWLARSKENSGRGEAALKLRLACAAWLAGEQLRRALGEADIAAVNVAQLTAAVHLAETVLARDFPFFAAALKGEGISGRKAVTEFGKWGASDAEVKLCDFELAAMAGLSDDDVLRAWLDGRMDARSPRWLMGWRRNLRTDDAAATIAAVGPRAGYGDSLFLFELPPKHRGRAAAFLGNVSSLVFDFVARQKVGGSNFSFYYMKQLPLLPSDRYSEADIDFIVPRVLELTYTAHDLAPWAADLGYHGESFAWNLERRARLRAELDAYYARLYGLSRDELRYILDPADVEGPDYPSETFRVLKNNEIREFGEYRTQRLVLDAWDRLDGLKLAG